MYITRLTPAYKDYIWGGQKLNTTYGKYSGMDITAESWELACHKDGMCLIADGELAGKTLLSVIENDKAALGEKAAAFEFFPILIKLIDAARDLSVQVHPSDDYALKNEGQYGKTEMWYVIDADEGASLVYGLKRDVSVEEFKKLAQSDALMDILNFVPAKKGDVFFIESGLIHAIGKGLLICEIQQNSNLTYRVYDYNRKDAQGNLRPLHLDKAAAVAKLTKSENNGSGKETVTVISDKVRINRLSSCKYFTVDEIIIDGRFTMQPDGSFISITVTEGSGTVEGLPVSAGTTVFIPADSERATVEGKLTFLAAYV